MKTKRHFIVIIRAFIVQKQGPKHRLNDSDEAWPT